MKKSVTFCLLTLLVANILSAAAVAETCLELSAEENVARYGSATNFIKEKGWREEAIAPFVQDANGQSIPMQEIAVASASIRSFYIKGAHLLEHVSMQSLIGNSIKAADALTRENEAAFTQVVEAMQHVPYYGNFLYGQTFSRESGAAFRRILISKHPDFAKAKVLDAEQGFVLTGSFEKETVSGKIGNIYEIENDPVSLMTRDAYEINRLNHASKLRKNAPQFLTTQYASEVSDKVVEFKHVNAEVNVSLIEKQMTEVAKLMGEENGFHAHLVWPEAFLPRVEYGKFKAWWTHLNDFLTLRGVEQGLFPGVYSEPVQPASDAVPEMNTKMRSAGFRRNLYGEGRIGVELRDVAKTIAETGKIYNQVVDSVSNKIWNEFEYSVETSITLQGKEGMQKLDTFLRENGVPNPIINMMMGEPKRSCVFVPMIDFSKMTYRNNFTPQQWAEARTQFMTSLLSTARQLQAEFVNNKNSSEVSEIAAIAVKLDVGAWAKKMQPSAIYSGY